MVNTRLVDTHRLPHSIELNLPQTSKGGLENTTGPGFTIWEDYTMGIPVSAEASPSHISPENEQMRLQVFQGPGLVFKSSRGWGCLNQSRGLIPLPIKDKAQRAEKSVV